MDSDSAQEHGELHPDVARNSARTALQFVQSFIGQRWDPIEDGPDRRGLAVALDYAEELAAMVLNLADRAAAPAPIQPLDGDWISAEDVRRNVKALDVALNGPGGAERPLLIDVLSQVEAIARRFGMPVLDALGAAAPIQPEPVAWIRRSELEKLKRDGHCVEYLRATPADDRVPLYASPPPPTGQLSLDAAAQGAEPVHLIVYDDHDVRPEIFAGSGATAAAHARFKAISAQWNAHLFVKLKSNTRDDPYANDNATLAQGAEAVEALRERAERGFRLYSELADALGSDPMDSHVGRLARARRLAALSLKEQS